ncbi:hypothetical protein L1887_49097 [Cichorium endivia]|nr:hypothetical protein L1887_49097 [Cichorium endivia]
MDGMEKRGGKGRDDGGEPRWRRDQMGREEMLSGRGEQQRGLALREEQVRLQRVEPRLEGRSQWCRGGGVRRAAKIDDEQDAASEAAEGGERRSGDGERPKEEGRLGALQERQEQDGARPRERETERGEGAFDGSGLMQSAMQPFRASDRAAFCTAFGSFGHAPLRIEASHRQAAHILMAWRGVAWHGMAWHGMAGSLAGWVFGEACMPCAYDTYIFQSLPKSPVGSTEAQGTPARRAARRQQTGTRTRSHQKSKSKKCVGLSAGRRDSSARARSQARPQLSIPERAPLSLSKLAGRQPVQAALPIATSEPSCRRCVVRPARKFPLPTSAPYRCLPSPHPAAAAKTSRRLVWHTRLQVARLRRGFLAVERAASAKLSERCHFGLRCGDRGARSRRFPHSPSRHRCSLQAGIQARCVHPPHTSQARPQSAD